MTKTTETIPAAAVKGVQVSATIAPDLYNALEEHRWQLGATNPAARFSFTELVRTAVEEYAKAHNVVPAVEDDAKA